MKSLHLASIFALSLTLTLACGDDEGDSTGAAGSSGAAAGGDNGAGEGPVGGKGGTESGGAGGEPAETCEFGVYEDADESEARGGGGGGGQASSGHELLGTWEEEFVGAIEITSAHWGSSGIAAYDGEANVLYTQSPCDAAYNPGRFSKIVYTEPTEDGFYYCTVVYDAKTLEEARASEATADTQDLDAGCGQSGFPWSKATR